MDAALTNGDDLCDILKKPKKILLKYTGNDNSNHSQNSNKAGVDGQVNGEGTVTVWAGSVDGEQWYSGTLFQDQTFGIVSRKSKGFPEATMVVKVFSMDDLNNPLQTIRFKVDCDEPLVDGAQFGSMKLMGYEDKYECGYGDFTYAEPAPNQGEDICAACDKPSKLMFQYMANDDSNHNQGTSKAFVDGAVNYAPRVQILAGDDRGGIWYAGEHSANETFVIDSGEDHFNRKDMYIQIKDPDTQASLQTLRINTRCDVPFVENDQFGSIKLIAYEDKHNCGFGDFPVATGGGGGLTLNQGDDTCDACAKPGMLMFEYTGGDVVNHNQGTSKAFVLGNSNAMSPAYISVSDEDGYILHGAEYSIGGIIALDSNSDAFSSKNLIFKIIDPNGEVGSALQTVSISTNCQVPLVENDEFGSIKLTGYKAPDGCGFGAFPTTTITIQENLPSDSTSDSPPKAKSKSRAAAAAAAARARAPAAAAAASPNPNPNPRPRPRVILRPVLDNRASDPENCVNWRDCNQGNCMEDNYFRYRNGGGLVCTAKDVTLEYVEANERMTCNEGDQVTVSLTGAIHFNIGRYDVGWYIAKDGGDALNGECYIQPLLEHDPERVTSIVASRGLSEVVGEITWDNDSKGQNDMCGDVHMFTGGGGVVEHANIGKELVLPCLDKDDSGNMDFAICFTWREPGGDATCIANELYPGAPSKCFCTRYNIPQITVNKHDDPLDCDGITVRSGGGGGSFIDGKSAKSAKEDKSAKSAKEDKSDKSAKEDKSAKSGTEDKSAKSAKEDKSAKSGKEDKSAKSAQGGQVGQVGQGGQVGQVGQGGQVGQAGHGGQVGQVGQGGQVDKSAKEAKSAKRARRTSRPSRPRRTSRPSRARRTSRPSRPRRTSRPSRARRTSRPSRPRRTSRPSRRKEDKSAKSGTEDKSAKSAKEDKSAKSGTEDKSAKSAKEDKSAKEGKDE